MEYRKDDDGEINNVIDYRIQSKYNLVRLKLYNLMRFNKRFNNYHKKYKENIIENIKRINSEFIINESHFYIIDENDYQRYGNGKSTEIPLSILLQIYSSKIDVKNGEKIYVISQKNFYRGKNNLQ